MKREKIYLKSHSLKKGIFQIVSTDLYASFLIKRVLEIRILHVLKTNKQKNIPYICKKLTYKLNLNNEPL